MKKVRPPLLSSCSAMRSGFYGLGLVKAQAHETYQLCPEPVTLRQYKDCNGHITS